MLQLRVVCPADRTDEALALLRAKNGVATLTVERGGAVVPAGDVLVCDVASEQAHEVIDGLRALGVERRGAITVLPVDVTVSIGGRRAEREAPGERADSMLWERVEQDARESATLTVTFVVLMAIAAVIATVGIALDSPVLVIGAMIVGPEFGPLAGVAVGLYRRLAFWPRAASTLLVGLAMAVGISALTTRVAIAFGQRDADFAAEERFFTQFVTDPNVWSIVVALAAGIAGMIALGQGRSTTLPGVLVSVTTIPAAAAMGVDLALGDFTDLWHAALQLALNLGALAVGGVATLAMHDRWWSQQTRPSRRTLP